MTQDVKNSEIKENKCNCSGSCQGECKGNCHEHDNHESGCCGENGGCSCGGDCHCKH